MLAQTLNGSLVAKRIAQQGSLQQQKVHRGYTQLSVQASSTGSDEQTWAPQPDVSRRSLVSGALAAVTLWGARPAPSQAGLFGGKSPLEKAFEKAMSLQDDPVALEAAWTEALKLAPNNAALLSNRGTARLTLKDYAGALEDLEEAKKLETQAYGYSSGFVLCALGNAKGALGDWEGAIDEYELAMLDEYLGISTLALGYLSLARFELGDVKQAVEDGQKALTAVPDYKDLAAALAGILWVSGDESAAREVCDTAGGKQSIEDFYNMQQVAGGWPPKTLEAVARFLSEA